MRTDLRPFWCGWAAAFGFVMALQDWLGLEGYIAYCREHWIELPWTIGAAIMVCAAIFAMKYSPKEPT